MKTLLHYQAYVFIIISLFFVLGIGVIGSRKGFTRNTLILLGILCLGLWPLSYVSVSSYNLELSKTVQFCGSCHAMKSKVNDLMNPESTSLAAQHAQRFWINTNACYTCHTDYTLYGPLKSKLTGLRHMYATLMGKNSDKKIKLYEPYKDSHCMRCHATKRFNEVEAHNDRDPDESCIDCHDAIHTQMTSPEMNSNE